MSLGPSARPLRWLFLDLNSYFASVEQQVQPHLRGRPVAVVPTLVDSTCCIAASYEAKAFGVKTGTIVSDAKILCPGIILIEGRHEIYVKYHHAIVEAFESCLPVQDVVSIDEMVGPLYGHEREPDAARKLAQHVKATIAERVGPYLKSSIGIAPNRFLAKVASDMQKPDGLTVLESHNIPQALFRLELRDLVGVGRNMERRLHAQGIYTVEQLCALDNKHMRTIWGGIGGERYAAWLRGEEVELPATQHRSLGHSHVLEPAMRNHAGAYRVAKRLTAKAAVRLRKMGYWAAGFAVSIQTRRDANWGRFTKLPDTQDTPTFLTLLREAWKEFPDNETPTWIGVTMAPLVPPQRHTLSLFTDDKRERLSHAMDQINNRFGKNTTYYANLFDVAGKAPTRISFTRVPDLSEF